MSSNEKRHSGSSGDIHDATDHRGFSPTGPLSPASEKPNFQADGGVHMAYDESFWMKPWDVRLLYARIVAQFIVSPGLPLIFLLVLAGKRELEAGPTLSRWTLHNPRWVLLGIGIISAILSFITINTWGLVLIIRARKRSLKFTPFLELETLSALSHGKTIWGWGIHYLPYTSITLIATCLLAVLTAGYTSMLAPLPLTRRETTSGWEPDFLATDPSCPQWFVSNNVHNPSNCGWGTIDGVAVDTCSGVNQMVDVLEIGRSTMVNLLADEIVALGNPHFEVEDSIPVYSLEGIHFDGRTGGVVPQGPGSPFSSDTTGLAGDVFNSSMRHQGLQATVNCQYTTSPLPIQFVNSSGDIFSLFTCPDGTQHNYLIDPTGRNIAHTVSAFNCSGTPLGPNRENTTFFVISSGETTDTQDVKNITCEVVTSIVDGTMSYNTSTETFYWLPDNNFTTSQPSFDMALEGTSDLELLLQNAQLPFAGNLLTDTVDSVFIPYVNGTSAPGVSLDFPTMLAQFMTGVLEYQASWLRYTFILRMLSQGTSPSFTDNPCIRNVTGNISFTVTGWDIGAHTIIGFVPAAIIGIMTLIMLAIVLHMGGRIPVFTPTSPVSLATAIASAKHHFDVHDEATLTPEDWNARSTKVGFAKHVVDKPDGTRNMGWVYTSEVAHRARQTNGNEQAPLPALSK